MIDYLIGLHDLYNLTSAPFHVSLFLAVKAQSENCLICKTTVSKTMYNSVAYVGVNSCFLSFIWIRDSLIFIAKSNFLLIATHATINLSLFHP